MKIDLILLTYKPGNDMVTMLELMNAQSIPVSNIYIYNVEQKFYDRLKYNNKALSEIKNITVRHISKRECDKGRTKNMAIEMSDADYFVVMDQSAVPKSMEVVSTLYNTISSDKSIAVAYSRQIPEDKCPEYIKYVKKYYFSEDSYVRSIKDFDKYGLMTFFMSNACAMYRRDVFDELGGFDGHVIINDDLIYAAKAINAGYKIAYAADSCVSYSADLTADDYEGMFFDYGVLCAKRTDLFNSQEIIESAKKMIKLTKNHLSRNGYRGEAFSFARFSRRMLKAYKKGRRYRLISRDKIQKISSNKGYWMTDELLRDRSGVNGRLGYGRSEAETDMLKTPPVNRHKWDADKE